MWTRNGSRQCDEGRHGDCNGNALIFDTPDGPNLYVCDCSCHDGVTDTYTCRECKGSGHMQTRRQRGRYVTEAALSAPSPETPPGALHIPPKETG